MKRPSRIQSYCVKCRKHVTMALSVVKKRSPSELSRGQRKFREVTSGYGGFPRPKPTPKKTNPIRRQNLLLRCQECNKAMHPGGIKSKRLQILKA